jgi:hypothetical protein
VRPTVEDFGDIQIKDYGPACVVDLDKSQQARQRGDLILGRRAELYWFFSPLLFILLPRKGQLLWPHVGRQFCFMWRPPPLCNVILLYSLRPMRTETSPYPEPSIKSWVIKKGLLAGGEPQSQESWSVIQRRRSREFIWKEKTWTPQIWGVWTLSYLLSIKWAASGPPMDYRCEDGRFAGNFKRNLQIWFIQEKAVLSISFNIEVQNSIMQTVVEVRTLRDNFKPRFSIQ